MWNDKKKTKLDRRKIYSQELMINMKRMTLLFLMHHFTQTVLWSWQRDKKTITVSEWEQKIQRTQRPVVRREQGWWVCAVRRIWNPYDHHVIQFSLNWTSHVSTACAGQRIHPAVTVNFRKKGFRHVLSPTADKLRYILVVVLRPSSWAAAVINNGHTILLLHIYSGFVCHWLHLHDNVSVCFQMPFWNSSVCRG